MHHLERVKFFCIAACSINFSVLDQTVKINLGLHFHLKCRRRSFFFF